MKRHRKIILISAVAVIAGLYGVRIWTTERNIRAYTIDQAALDVTSFTYEFLAEAAEDALDDLLSFSRLPLRERVETACLSLKMTKADGEPYCPTISVRQGGQVGIFLFSDANGLLMLTDDLIAACGDDDAMLQGVIAHELGHVARLREGPDFQYWSHSKRRILAQTHGKARYDLLSEEFDAAVAQILENPQGLVDYAFTPAEEAEASAYAHDLLKKTGLPQDGFERCLQRLRDNPELPGARAFLNSHPAPKLPARP